MIRGYKRLVRERRVWPCALANQRLNLDAGGRIGLIFWLCTSWDKSAWIMEHSLRAWSTIIANRAGDVRTVVQSTLWVWGSLISTSRVLTLFQWYSLSKSRLAKNSISPSCRTMSYSHSYGSSVQTCRKRFLVLLSHNGNWNVTSSSTSSRASCSMICADIRGSLLLAH